MKIGIPKEIDQAEPRVAAVPDTIKKLKGLGADVAVEPGAGVKSGVPDSEFQAAGAQTLTVFGLHVPDRLITAENNEERRAELQAAVLKSLNSVLAEPVEELLLTGPDGLPCIETKTTLDIERAVGMPRGNIFRSGSASALGPAAASACQEKSEVKIAIFPLIRSNGYAS